MFGLVSKRLYDAAVLHSGYTSQELMAAKVKCEDLENEVAELKSKLAAAEQERRELSEQLIDALQNRPAPPKPDAPSAPAEPVSLTGPEVVERAMRHRNKVATGRKS